MISVIRMPNSSSITTTSPAAMRRPLTSRSMGAPAARSISTTMPGVSPSSSRTGIVVRPSSAVTTSSTSLRALSEPPAVEVFDALTGSTPGSKPCTVTSLPFTSWADPASTASAAASAAFASLSLRSCWGVLSVTSTPRFARVHPRAAKTTVQPNGDLSGRCGGLNAGRTLGGRRGIGGTVDEHRETSVAAPDAGVERRQCRRPAGSAARRPDG